MRTWKELFEKDFEEHLNITREVAVRDESSKGMLSIQSAFTLISRWYAGDGEG